MPVLKILQNLLKTYLQKYMFTALEIGTKAIFDLHLPKVLVDLIFQYCGIKDSDKELIVDSDNVPQWKNLTTLFAKTGRIFLDSQKQTNEKSGSNTLSPS
jgi:hypothetical protein